MAIELLKESDPKKVEAWDRIHDKRKLYRCERCGAEWKCEYHENEFGSQHEYNGDPDILCQCCGFPTAKEVVLREIPYAIGVDLSINGELKHHTYPGVADDITEEAYDRRDGKR